MVVEGCCDGKGAGVGGTTGLGICSLGHLWSRRRTRSATPAEVRKRPRPLGFECRIDRSMVGDSGMKYEVLTLRS